MRYGMIFKVEDTKLWIFEKKFNIGWTVVIIYKILKYATVFIIFNKIWKFALFQNFDTVPIF